VTSYGDVSATDVSGPISIENEHGDIVVRLPVGPKYDIRPEVKRGKIRVDDAFDDAFEPAVAAEGGAIPIVLKTTYDDIVVKPSGSRAGGTARGTGEQS
jgi:hypothetical protein